MASKQQGKIGLKRPSREFTAGFCILRGAPGGLSEYVPLLHPEERAYYDSLRAEKRKQSFLLGRVAAKLALSELVEIRDMEGLFIDSGVFKFPVVIHPSVRNMQVSISHCGDFGVALAFPEAHPLGIDLEAVREKSLKALATQMTAREKELLLATPLSEGEGLTLMWTVKEALSKALKTGLAMDVKLYEAKSIEYEGSIFESRFLNTIQYKAMSCFFNRYALSIALPRKTIPDLEAFWNAFRELNG